MSRFDFPGPALPSHAGGAGDLVQLLLDALPSGALLTDGSGKILMVNQRAERILGWPAAKLIGQPAHEWFECSLEELADEPENCPIARTLQGENIASPGRMSLTCRGAVAKPVEFRCSRYPCAGGMGAILAFNDITHELAVEKDLRSLASIAEACPLAIVELNEDANLIHANPAMMSLMDRFGFGAGLHAAVLPENIAALTADCLARQCEIGAIEVNVGDCCYEWKLVPVAGERVARGYGVDLTARKRTELALARAQIEAESANRAKSEFLTNMSHELRTPLNGVIGMAELLADSKLADDQRECAETIQTCAGSLMRVIEELLTMADLAGGRSTSEPSVFGLGPCVHEVSESYRCLAQQRGLRVSLAIAPELPVRVYGDRKRLKQILHRLLGNALKFTQQGEIRVDVGPLPARPRGVQFGAERLDYLDDAIYFAIADTGVGIAPEKQAVIFERFAQADGTNTRSFGGTGLGLAVARELVEALGGAIGVDSEPGKGSSFWFAVPLPAALPSGNGSGNFSG